MTETKFTPGPWYADRRGKIWRRHPSELVENGGGVAGDYPLATASDGAAPWEIRYPREANARLIAAAPEMFEALRLLIEFTERQTASWPDQPGSLRLARAALSKALGNGG